MINAENLKKINKELETIQVKGKAYAMVNKRVMAFRSLCPQGCISTEIIRLDDGVVTMRTTVKDEEGKVLGTGIAQEKESASYINKTSYLENCETSAVGRALGMCGIGIDESMASAEEVANAILNQNQNQSTTKNKRSKGGREYATDAERRTYMAACKRLGADSVQVLKKAGWQSGKMTVEQYSKALVILEEIENAQKEESKDEVNTAG